MVLVHNTEDEREDSVIQTVYSQKKCYQEELVLPFIIWWAHYNSYHIRINGESHSIPVKAVQLRLLPSRVVLSQDSNLCH